MAMLQSILPPDSKKEESKGQLLKRGLSFSLRSKSRYGLASANVPAPGLSNNRKTGVQRLNGLFSRNKNKSWHGSTAASKMDKDQESLELDQPSLERRKTVAALVLDESCTSLGGQELPSSISSSAAAAAAKRDVPEKRDLRISPGSGRGQPQDVPVSGGRSVAKLEARVLEKSRQDQELRTSNSSNRASGTTSTTSRNGNNNLRLTVSELEAKHRASGTKEGAVPAGAASQETTAVGVPFDGVPGAIAVGGANGDDNGSAEEQGVDAIVPVASLVVDDDSKQMEAMRMQVEQKNSRMQELEKELEEMKRAMGNVSIAEPVQASSRSGTKRPSTRRSDTYSREEDAKKFTEAENFALDFLLGEPEPPKPKPQRNSDPKQARGGSRFKLPLRALSFGK